MKQAVMTLFILLLLPATALSETVRIAAAASLSSAVRELTDIYRQQQPQVEIQINLASSGTLARQIEAGAAADIYISANPKWMTYLQEKGLVDEASRRIWVHNRLVLVGNSKHSIKALEDLLTLQRIALGSPNSAPVGRYAQQALQAAGLYGPLQAAGKLVPAKDVRQTLLYAERGEVDAAFVYRTDALQAKQSEILFEVPPHLYPQIDYPVALIAGNASKASVRAVYDFLFSHQGKQVLLEHGFVLP